MNFNKFILLLFTVLLLVTCGKDDFINCECEKLPNADFTISQGLGWDDDRRYFESDTLLKGSVKVEAIDKDLFHYKWKIGTDPTIRTGKTVELNYDVTGDITVTLIADWTPRKDCFPNDIGVDTVTKTFHLNSRWDSQIFGNFEGFYESTPDSIITIYVQKFIGGGVAFVNNIPSGCFEDDVYLIGTYRHFYMPDYDAKIPCPRPEGWGAISEDNQTLTLEYEIWDIDLSEKVNRKFIGIRK